MKRWLHRKQKSDPNKTAEIACPTEQQLHDFLIGRAVPELFDIQEHFRRCPSCLNVARKWRPDLDPVVDSMRLALALNSNQRDEINPDLEQRLIALGDNLNRTGLAGQNVPHSSVSEGEMMGDYRIIRLLATGGMGDVYLATDTKLNRTVALKRIAGSRLNQQAWMTRFHREAELAASLNHPNIVQLYEYRLHEGIPFFAMEYVDHGSFEQRLATQPALTTRESAAFVEQISRAVHHAHERGVIHRDLKPANILIAADGSARIADFGLARNFDGSGHQQTPETLTGEVLGTPAYMAPEQTTGRSSEVGPSADVYSLGAILYECLAGRPPFRALNSMQMIELVRCQEPVPPSQLLPGLPLELQTVCLKCLEKTPSRRYRSALELADELHRFLDGKPIIAQPIGSAGRFLKWARRRPDRAALLATVVVALVGLFVAITIHNWRLNREIARVDQQRKETAQQRQRADSNYRQARQTVHSMLDTLDAMESAGLPRLEELRRTQSKFALEFFESISGQSPESAEIGADAARASLNAAKICIGFGEMERAESLFQNAIQAIESVENSRISPRIVKDLRADAFEQFGILMRIRNRHASSIDLLTKSLKIREERLANQPDSTELQQLVAQTHHNLGASFQQAVISGEVVVVGASPTKSDVLANTAADHYQRAIDIKQALSNGGDLKDSEISLALTYTNLSLLLQAKQDLPAAEVAFRSSMKLYEKALAASPDDLKVLMHWTIARTNWAYTLENQGRFAEGIELLAPCVDQLERALEREPTYSLLRETLVNALGMSAQLATRAGRFGTALEYKKRVVEVSPESNRLFQRLFLPEAMLLTDDVPGTLAEIENLLNALPDDSDFRWFQSLAESCSQVLRHLIDDPPPEILASTTHQVDFKAVSDTERLASRALEKCRNTASPEEWTKTMDLIRLDPSLEKILENLIPPR